jgi:hypothetical protein
MVDQGNIDISAYHYGGIAYTGSVMDGVQVNYEYSKKDLATSYIDVSYVTNTGEVQESFVDPFYGNITAEAQRISNHLPHWMEWREDPVSVGQTLVHSWAQNLDHIKKQFKSYRQNQFLPTAKVHNDIHYGYSDLGILSANSYQGKFNNGLYNSSFNIVGPSRYRKPMGWTFKETVPFTATLYKEESLFGQNALLLDGSVGLCEVKQKRNSTVSNGTITFSIFFKVLEQPFSSTESYDASEAGIILQLEYADSTVKSIGAGFSKKTKDKWNRASCTATIEKELKSFNVVILNRTSAKYLIDLPQVERGKQSTNWTASLFDVHPTQDGAIRRVSGIQVSSLNKENHDNNKVEVLPTFSSEEFQSTIIPTRVEQISVTEDSKPFTDLLYSTRMNYHEEEQLLKWPAENGKITEKSTVTPDVFGEYLPAEYIYTENGEVKLDKSLIDASGVSVKATTILDDMLYCVTEETYQSTSRFYLKIVKPHRVSETSDYLQCLGDIELPIKLGNSFGQNANTEDVIRLGFSRSVSDTIYVDTSLDRRLYFRLFYDYYYADLSSRKIYCREKYWPDYGQLQVV